MDGSGVCACARESRGNGNGRRRRNDARVYEGVKDSARERGRYSRHERRCERDEARDNRDRGETAT